ncbi:hypothetical protein [Thioalkalivibrio paradoxus]|uniref:Uncharacterized protein n=1 Tax=Thioalkalivibrio paradoxus ARh 1 TaxID=713585 RepID=W0DSC9_9GAMM|nr:hypothetical protein [Thioalkalivibrio paradoxus]AHE99893.1 hypothetical protein THITH_03125 [Thioalkalivibrio paradoxus ARh 1]
MATTAVRHANHRVRLQRPYYALEAGTELHRYQETDFIPRFLQDLESHALEQPQASIWQFQDRFSRHDESVVLRLPIHRSFYLISCEIACDRPGFPALDPARIASAGFVIRSVRGNEEHAWMLEDGAALGWQPAAAEPRDPDARRRLCPDGSVRPRQDTPTYSGEETHPLHPVVTRDRNGKCRTVLYGYLPLGGFHYYQHSAGETPFDAASERSVQQALERQLPWPFGLREAPARRRWRDGDACHVEGGRPTMAFFELLRMLVNRYHLGEAGIVENAGLEELLGEVRFLNVRRGRESEQVRPRESLAEYLRSCAGHGGDNPLLRWIIGQEDTMDRHGGAAPLAQLPDATQPASDSSGSIEYRLEFTEAQAARLRELLLARVSGQLTERAREVPIPKFQQGRHDLYQVVPFVRVLDGDGREHLVWATAGQRSRRFRVAAPFDPEASRPAVIQMPGLADLKRGLAKGVSMITPADTFNLIDRIKFKKGVTADAVPDSAPPGGTLQWICSFSLPVVTLVAMILLMIMVSLLNILFWWLPWVRICLPFPKLKR